MERSDKQRKPVAIKNLAELKRFIQPGVEFKTLSQKNHPDLVGLTRVVTTVQTVCFYSKIKDQPNSRFSTDNGGKGFRTDFAKADAYIFDGTTVKVKDTRNKDRGVIYEFESRISFYVQGILRQRPWRATAERQISWSIWLA